MGQEIHTAEAGAADLLQWVVLTCGGARYALALERARGLLTPRAYTRLPATGPIVAGLVGVRSRVVTCFDLGVLLAGRPARLLPDHRVLLVEHAGRVWGLVVDGAVGVAALAPGDRQALPGELSGRACAWEGGAVWALDLDEVCERLLAPVAA